jgi:hypothetical protein
LLSDASAGDSALFARVDAVETAWVVVDKVRKRHTHVLPSSAGVGTADAARLSRMAAAGTIRGLIRHPYDRRANAISVMLAGPAPMSLGNVSS